MYIYKNPLLLGIISATLKGDLDIFIHAVASQGKPIPPKIVLVYQKNNSNRKTSIHTQSQSRAPCSAHPNPLSYFLSSPWCDDQERITRDSFSA
jgi:hypothetical protein